jgi:1-aminocyclopropane-1-carboxylate deaminase/D-cysteine desulfhydrase-like pyridoxal-dependent ACC family enzyme
MIFDPTYTGKALAGLRRDIAAGKYGPEDNIVFWHTGGGFAVFAHDFTEIAAAGDPVAQNV